MMKISVIIPLYNKKETIERALRSVLSQTLQFEEILVINDGSDDGSEKVVEILDLPLVRLIHQTNSGVSAARNRGIEEAKGEWIAFLDADDEWMPDFLETIKYLSLTYPHCQVLATAYIMTDHNGLSKRIILKKMPFTGKYGLLSNYFEVAACSHPPVHSSSIVVKKSAIKSIGGFPSSVKLGEDLLTWARLMIKYKLAYSVKPCATFIQDPEYSYTGKPKRLPEEPDVVGSELIALAKSHLGVPDIKHYISHWFKMRASIYIRLGMKKRALNEIRKAIYYNPLNWKLYVYILLLLVSLSNANSFFRKFGHG